MSCWVAPALAAELWGVPVAQVMEGIARGAIPFRKELGFTLVDVAPDSPQITPLRTPPEQRPPTFTMIRLAGQPPAAVPLDPPLDDGHEAVSEAEVAALRLAGGGTEESEEPDGSEPATSNWRMVRMEVSRTRIRPRSR